MTALATAPTDTPTISPAVMALAHAIRRDIVACIAQGITTPKDIAHAKGHPLGVVSYHVRMLRDYGVLEARDPIEAAFGWYKPGRFAWHLSDVEPIEPAIPIEWPHKGPAKWATIPDSRVAGARA